MSSSKKITARKITSRIKNLGYFGIYSFRVLYLFRLPVKMSYRFVATSGWNRRQGDKAVCEIPQPQTGSSENNSSERKLEQADRNLRSDFPSHRSH